MQKPLVFSNLAYLASLAISLADRPRWGAVCKVGILKDLGELLQKGLVFGTWPRWPRYPLSGATFQQMVQMARFIYCAH